jgi:hypothetical protein
VSSLSLKFNFISNEIQQFAMIVEFSSLVLLAESQVLEISGKGHIFKMDLENPAITPSSLISKL